MTRTANDDQQAYAQGNDFFDVPEPDDDDIEDFDADAYGSHAHDAWGSDPDVDWENPSEAYALLSFEGTLKYDRSIGYATVERDGHLVHIELPDTDGQVAAARAEFLAYCRPDIERRKADG